MMTKHSFDGNLALMILVCVRIIATKTIICIGEHFDTLNCLSRQPLCNFKLYNCKIFISPINDNKLSEILVRKFEFKFNIILLSIASKVGEVRKNTETSHLPVNGNDSSEKH